MTTAEKNELKMQALDDCIASLRHIVRHNGAAITAKATIAEVADHVLDFSTERVKTLWTDINTIDRVKQILYLRGWMKTLTNRVMPDELLSMTAEELMEYAVNDERLTAGHHSWAVVKITKKGTEILTCGGNFYQAYKKVTTTEEVTEEVLDESTGETTTVTNTVENTEIVQDGDTDLLAAALNEEDAAWMAEIFESDIHGYSAYIEGGEEFIQVPCELPGDLAQLISIAITRTKIEDGTVAAPLEYSLTENSCDTSNEGMVELPHGIWLIYDNSSLVSAPQGLLIPKALADGTETGFRFNTVKIAYNSLVSGMERLRLVGDSFGDEYIIGTIDLDSKMGGTWKE